MLEAVAIFRDIDATYRRLGTEQGDVAPLEQAMSTVRTRIVSGNFSHGEEHDFTDLLEKRMVVYGLDQFRSDPRPLLKRIGYRVELRSNVTNALLNAYPRNELKQGFSPILEKMLKKEI